MTIFPLDGMTGVTIAREPGRLLVSSSPPFPSGAEGQVIALAERGLKKEGSMKAKRWNMCRLSFGNLP